MIFMNRSIRPALPVLPAITAQNGIRLYFNYPGRAGSDGVVRPENATSLGN